MIGLFTSKAYVEPASQTPLLNRKLRQILRHEDLIEGSHDYKAAVALFDSFPKDELFSARADDLRRAVVELLSLEGDRVRLLGRRSADNRSVSLIAALPASRYDPDVLEAFLRLLRERFGTDAVAAQTVLGEGERVRVHVTVHVPDGVPDIAVRDLEQELVSLTRTWDDGLRERLLDRFGPTRGAELAARWGPRFPGYYRASVEPALAIADVECFERLEREREPFVVGLQNEAGRTRVALYKTGGKVELGDAMPTLEDLGLRVIEEVPTRLKGGDGETWVQDFGVLGPGDRPLDLGEVGERLADTITAVRKGETESDTLNRLVVLAGLEWRQVDILRAYRMYRQRIGSRFTQAYQNDVLAANPEVTAALVRYFEQRFDPDRPPDEAAEQALREEILAGLDAVASLDHDRILRNQLLLIDATLRTNAFDPDREVTAFKLRSADVPAIPQPPPLFEIYVYSPAMEGIHLRGGPVARGGIRWSDRQDYRTEVFGLMRAQLTKNAVIVPAGAKGGFYLKRPPGDRDELKAEVERQYVRYIGGLLDLTDNRVENRVVHPERVRVHDDDDTYLVVAADKGTATFSDTANRVSEERGFWLGDAFASGGSSGYDHKALGITARGAWESVKRHLSELGLDPATDPFTVVGIGDMSGDVFGNGMLLSEQIRLVAAYDHRHVFIDPDPDPATGFAERKRLFELPGSSWDDYDRARISEGGGVWPRAAKSIPLSEQARAALGVEEERMAPADVIRAILRAPVDLLFNGGIGTVVKASDETDDDAQDRASDAIRVDAADLRCRAVGEGGNLGLTRRARVEFAAAGGLVNADFIDNSAGVDCSDHEVNLKILLGLAERRGELDRPRARRAAAGGHRRRRRARALRQLPAGADPRPGGRGRPRPDVRLRGPDERARGGRPARPRLRGAAGRRGDRRAPPRRPRAGAPRARAAARLRQALDRARPARLRPVRGPVAGGRPALLLPGRRGRALRPPARRAPAAAPADRHGERQPRRQLARADVRVPARGGARRRRRRHRPRVPRRARGDRRGRPLGRDRAAAARHRPHGRRRAHARGRPARRRRHPLVPRARRPRAARASGSRPPRRRSRGSSRCCRRSAATRGARSAGRRPTRSSPRACPRTSPGRTRACPSSCRRRTSSPSPSTPAARWRTSRGRTTCSPSGSTSSGCSARSRSSPSRRARSAGRSRRCARTASTRSPSWRAARSPARPATTTPRPPSTPISRRTPRRRGACAR